MSDGACDTCDHCSKHAPTRGEYRFPVDRDAVVYSSHHRSPYHKGRMACAVDVKVPEGTPVKAARSGTVVDLHNGSTRGGRSRRFDPYENWVELDHGDGETSLYGHLRAVFHVRVGDRVQAGEVIARSGGTGTLADLGPHLHFEVRRYQGGQKERDSRSLRIRWEGGGHIPKDMEPARDS